MHLGYFASRAWFSRLSYGFLDWEPQLSYGGLLCIPFQSSPEKFQEYPMPMYRNSHQLPPIQIVQHDNMKCNGRFWFGKLFKQVISIPCTSQLSLGAEL